MFDSVSLAHESRCRHRYTIVVFIRCFGANLDAAILLDASLKTSTCALGVCYVAHAVGGIEPSGNTSLK